MPAVCRLLLTGYLWQPSVPATKYFWTSLPGHLVGLHFPPLVVGHGTPPTYSSQRAVSHGDMPLPRLDFQLLWTPVGLVPGNS